MIWSHLLDFHLNIRGRPSHVRRGVQVLNLNVAKSIERVGLLFDRTISPGGGALPAASRPDRRKLKCCAKVVLGRVFP